jgi:gluconokinase
LGLSGHILAVDVGSSSVRCSLYDGEGGLVKGTGASVEHGFTYTRDGGSTLDADELCGLIFGTIDETLARAEERSIVGIASSMFWHSVLGVDRRGHPTTPILTWADTRAAGAAGELRARLNGAAVHRRTGGVLHSSYLPAKLLWLSRSFPEAFSKTERFLSPDEYLRLRLFGEAKVGISMASGTGLFDQNRKVWDEELLDALPVGVGQLSPISDEPSQGLRKEWARRWPVLEDAPWLPAVGDGACSNLGSGCVGSDKMALMVGTSAALRVLWRAHRARVPEGLWCYRACAKRFVAGGALSDGGNLVAWLRETLRLPGKEETEELLAGMEPDAHGLTFLPLLARERAPGWAAGASGSVAGLSMATRPVEILRATMEGVALRFALVARRLDEAFPERSYERHTIAAGGGLLSSPAWLQIMSDALGRPVTVSGIPEASSRGAVLLALEALGGPPVEEVEAPLGKVYEPDLSRHAVYEQALDRQRKLYDAVVREKE